MNAFSYHLLRRIIPAYILAVLIGATTLYTLIVMAELSGNSFKSFLISFFEFMYPMLFHMILWGVAITFPFALCAICITESLKWRSLAMHFFMWIFVVITGNYLLILLIDFRQLPAVLLVPVAFASIPYWAIAGRHAGSWRSK